MILFKEGHKFHCLRCNAHFATAVRDIYEGEMIQVEMFSFQPGHEFKNGDLLACKKCHAGLLAVFKEQNRWWALGEAGTHDH